MTPSPSRVRAAETLEQASRHHAASDLDAAIAAYEQALRLDEGLHAAWYAQACAWEAKGDDAKALASFERAAALEPRHVPSQHNLGKVLHTLGLTDQAVSRFRLALDAGGGFQPRTALATIIPGAPSVDQRGILLARREWAETHLPPREPTTESRRPPRPDGKIRVGYLSSFFDRDNWMKPVWGLVNHHDRGRFAVHLFSDAPLGNCRRCYHEHPEDRFHEISGLSNRAAAAVIANSDLDVLVDLNGYSRIDRFPVVALRPAPVVIGWFNYYATSGIPALDYLIGDADVVDPGEEPAYSEKILRVSGSYLTFDVRYPVPDVVAPPVLERGTLTFGSLASLYKLTPPVVDAWAAILRRLPDARLVLRNKTLGTPVNQDFLWQRFEASGVARTRVSLLGPATHFDFLETYGQIDIALDTFPYNGGTTTMESLWQGVPVLTFRGDRWASRQSASLLRAAGLDQWVAKSADEFVERAVALGESPETPQRLSNLRMGMRAALLARPVCDTARFAANMEELFRQVVTDGSVAE